MSPRTRALLAINGAALIFGSAALYGTLPVAVVWIVAARSAVAALFLTGITTPRWDWTALRPQRPALLLSSLALAAHWLLFYACIKLGGIALATLTFATFPFVTLLRQAYRERRWPTRVAVLATVLIVLAVALLADGGHTGRSPLATLLGLASAVAYVVYWESGRPLALALGDARATAAQNAGCALWCLPWLAWSAPAPGSVQAWGWLVALGIVNTAAGLVLVRHAMRFLDETTCSGFIALEPVYAIALAAALLGQPPRAMVVLCAVLIVSASVLLLRDEQRRRVTMGT